MFATQFQIIGGHIEQLIVERSEYERCFNQTVQQGKENLWSLDPDLQLQQAIHAFEKMALETVPAMVFVS